MKYFITGGAGFIGSSMATRLSKNPTNSITIYDNFSTGLESFIKDLRTKPNVTIIHGDILNFELLKNSMNGHEFVFHFSANADVRFGINHTRRDLEQNTIGTYNVMEAMRLNGVKRIAFSSTGSVYGEAPVIPTPENAPLPIQTSLYGASKMAGEGLITAFAEGFDMQVYIFRFVSILGPRYTHGHIFDFYKQLKAHPEYLDVLGNGLQRKSYLHIDDCLNAIQKAIETQSQKVNIFNLGTDEYCEVNDSIGWICNYLNLKPELRYSGGQRGWIGDNPFIFLDCKKIKDIGWTAKYSIQSAVIDTVKFIESNEWIFNERK